MPAYSDTFSKFGRSQNAGADVERTAGFEIINAKFTADLFSVKNGINSYVAEKIVRDS